MNQEKIGKFLSQCRRAKKLTQADLATLLGVTDRSVSNWENGKHMPDLALFKPLCSILEISINDLLSGEKIDEVVYQNKLEENLIKTLTYSNQKVIKYQQIIALIFMAFGFVLILSSLMIFPSESSWGSIYSSLGLIILFGGIYKLTNFLKKAIRLILVFLGTLITISILIFTDYLSVINNNVAPMYRIRTTTTGDVIYYDTLFYDVFRCYFDTPDEYWQVTANQKLEVKDLLNYCHKK